MPSGSPFSGAPKSVPGAPRSVPGAPLSVPGGPTRSGIKESTGSGFGSFLTTVEDQASSGEFRDMHTAQIRNFQGQFAGPWGIAWQGLDSLSEGLVSFGKDVEHAVGEGAQELADEMVAWAKDNAVWEDRTTDARQGLQAVVIQQGTRTTIWFGHSVPYGIWLEIMQNGRFAIVLPTVLQFAPRLNGRVAAHI